MQPDSNGGRPTAEPLPSALMIAFHFPPWKGSSGLERTLGLYRHLPANGWQPIVLTAAPRAYPITSDERMDGIREDTHIHRAFALDSRRHLAIAGRSLGLLTIPDPWLSWVAGAVPKGLSLIRRHRPSAIWSTYPIATAHVVGYLLARLTGLPWVADFRDPMVETDPRTGIEYPTNARVRRARLWIERKCARHAARAIFCTEGARRIFLERYPSFAESHAIVIPNGYDEAAFAAAERETPPIVRQRELITLVHSGVLYPGPDRDPRHFLEALKRFMTARPEWQAKLRVILRATGFDDQYRPVIDALELSRIVQLEPQVPYQRALAEMLAADGLLLFQGYTSNPAIPAKLYEYLRARKPILAMVDADGDTARLLRSIGVGQLAAIDDTGSITEGLDEFLRSLTDGSAPCLSLDAAARYERRHAATALSDVLAGCTGKPVLAVATK